MTNEKETTKKPYERPTLKVYGDIREITQTGTNTRTSDSHTGGLKT